MSEDSAPEPAQTAETKRRRAAEQERRARALRANLAKRKAQLRARETPDEGGSEA